VPLNLILKCGKEGRRENRWAQGKGGSRKMIRLGNTAIIFYERRERKENRGTSCGGGIISDKVQRHPQVKVRKERKIRDPATRERGRREKAVFLCI